MPHKTLDEIIEELIKLNNTIVFPQYYSHEEAICWKILHTHTTKYAEDKIVLCKVGDMEFYDVIELAIHAIKKRQEEDGE